MKKLPTLLIKAIPLMLVMLVVMHATGQKAYAPLAAGDFNLTLENDVQTADNVLEFDVYLLDTEATEAFLLGTVQAGILVNPDIYNGGTISMSIVSGSSQLVTAQQPTSVVWSQAQNTIKLTPKPGPGAGNATTISTTAPGTRVCRLRMTNTVAFTANTTANLTLNFTTVPYPTRVSRYIEGVNTALVTSTSNCFSNADNIVLNSSIPSQWTGAINTSWTEDGNWTAGVPFTGSNAMIAPAANQPTISTAVSLSNLILNTDAILTVSPTGQLTVSNSLTNNALASGLVVKSGGSLITNGSVTGMATVESAISGGEWHLISSPVADAVSGMFLGKYLQQHNETTNTYSDIFLTTEPLAPVKGFALYDETVFTAQYIGSLNTGAISYATTYSGVGKGWNLVGNPYPSSIDWNAATGWTKDNVNASTYIHVDATKWATFNGTVGTNGGTRFIAPCQGFFVEASAAGSLGMNDDVRVHNTTTFFKNTDEVAGNLVRLEVSGNGYADEAVIWFNAEATPEFDGAFDAHKLYGDLPEAAQLYSLGNTPLSINTLPETSTVPVGIHVGAFGTYSIAAIEVNNIDKLTLEDTQTGIFTELLTNPYSFTSAPGDKEQRFLLHFGPLGMEEPENDFPDIYSWQNTLYIDLKMADKGEAFVYTVTGQLVKHSPVSAGMNRISLSNTGCYIVKVICPELTQVKKVWLQ